MAGVAMTLPLSASTTAIILLPQPAKQAAMLAINRQPARLLAGSERPTRFHQQLLRIDRVDLAPVFDVNEDLALAITGGKFRLALQLDGAEYVAASCIDCGGIVAAAVEGEHPLARWIVEDSNRDCLPP